MPHWDNDCEVLSHCAFSSHKEITFPVDTCFHLQLDRQEHAGGGAKGSSLPSCISWAEPTFLVVCGPASLPLPAPFALLNSMPCNARARQCMLRWGASAAELAVVFSQESEEMGRAQQARGGTAVLHTTAEWAGCVKGVFLSHFWENSDPSHWILLRTYALTAGIVIAFSKAIFVLFIFCFTKGALLTYLSAI